MTAPARAPRWVAASILLAVVVLGGCGTAAPAAPTEQASQKGTAMPACQPTGHYRLVPSVNGSYPLLPAAPAGASATPRVRMVSSKPQGTPPTLDVSIIADDPALGGPQEFGGLTVGQTAEYGGYTIRVTDICDGESWFDLTAHP